MHRLHRQQRSLEQSSGALKSYGHRDTGAKSTLKIDYFAQKLARGCEVGSEGRDRPNLVARKGDSKDEGQREQLASVRYPSDCKQVVNHLHINFVHDLYECLADASCLDDHIACWGVDHHAPLENRRSLQEIRKNRAKKSGRAHVPEGDKTPCY